MLKYLFISLFLHLIVLAGIYSYMNIFPSLERDSDYRKIDIRGIGFYSVDRKVKTRKTHNKKVRKVVKSSNNRDLLPKKSDNKVKEKEIVAESKPMENAGERKIETGKVKNPEQGDKEVFREASENIVAEEGISKDENNNSNNSETEDYSLTYKMQNLEIIRRIIADSIEYPIVARRMGWEGTVVVGFTLSKDGDLLSIEIIKSSGYSLLDEYTVSVIKEVYKRFPLPERDVRIKIPVSYHLE